MNSYRGSLLAKHLALIAIIIALNFTQVSGTLAVSKCSKGRLLAEQSKDLGDTARVDPLDGLNKYRGGYNITNKHYWSSTTFTSIYGIAIAVVWLLCGILYGLFALYGHFRAACGMVFGGNKMFYVRAEKIVGVVSDTANEATDSISLISGAFKHINSSLLQVGSSNKATEFLYSTTRELDGRSAELQQQASHITYLIRKGLHTVYDYYSDGFGNFDLCSCFTCLVVICWIFVTITWLFFGVYFFFDNLAGDTCTALEGFERDPYNNSLSAVLPCDKLRSAQSVLINVGKGIHDSVNKVNENITASYGDILQFCNPFASAPMYDYEPWNCPPSSTKIGDIPRVLRMVACPDDEVKTCNGGIMIRGTYFRMVQAYSVAIQRLLDVYPEMENIIECRLIKDAFSKILDNHCKPLKKSLHMIWGSFVALSIVLMVLLIIWIAAAHRHQDQTSTRPRAL
ncbi:uncharacterized protein LOC127252942 [Andrographis paniculata]|uniref:uncharacterized protein LOC127252942 n=1 Tax=Andrographis paniculata TaxID=175694 RepID=UPI0021E6DAD1|nr:uncharacterized protein LOC127252942 [Andrographis paniculata]